MIGRNKVRWILKDSFNPFVNLLIRYLYSPSYVPGTILDS